VGFRLRQFVRKPELQRILCAVRGGGPPAGARDKIKPCKHSDGRLLERRGRNEFQGSQADHLRRSRSVAAGRRRQGRGRATNHASSGAWAAAGGIGTVSAVNADSYDAEGKIVPQVYHALTRKRAPRTADPLRHRRCGRTGARAHEISPAARARSTSTSCGKWAARSRSSKACWNRRAAGHRRHLRRGHALQAERDRGSASTSTTCRSSVRPAPSARCGSGPIHKVSDLLAAVVYEDPWLAGGHNGLSNAEDPLKPEDPYPRVKALRDTMRAEGIADDVPIVMAGGVWFLREWENWIDNPELGTIAFQFGTRPLLTQESPIPQGWKDALRDLEPGDVLLHRFSPTGFYSRRCAIPSCAASRRARTADSLFRVEAGEHTVQLDVGVKGKNFWVRPRDRDRARAWFGAGFTEGAAHARRYDDLRRRCRARGDPQGPGRLHGLPVALRVLVVEGPRRLHHRAPGRSAQLLHPEDPAGHRPRRPDSTTT
jgi:nitronate monooxygenase